MREKGEVIGTTNHQTLINPIDKTKPTNLIVQPQQAGIAMGPHGAQQQKAPTNQVGDNPVVRKLFYMPDESGPQIRMPWFQGKPEEKVERYFRELERLKAIYEWNEAKTINMALHGWRGRTDTFAHLKESMIKIGVRLSRNVQLVIWLP